MSDISLEDVTVNTYSGTVNGKTRTGVELVILGDVPAAEPV